MVHHNTSWSSNTGGSNTIASPPINSIKLAYISYYGESVQFNICYISYSPLAYSWINGSSKSKVFGTAVGLLIGY